MSYYVLYALSVTPTVQDPLGQPFSYIVKSFYLTGMQQLHRIIPII